MRMPRIAPRPTMLGLVALLTLSPAAWAQDADDPAERKVMERFLNVLEKTPRRGTALDRVYGYHVEHGSLDALAKRYEDRTKADKSDGAAWLLLGLIEAQRGRDASAVAALRQAERARPDDPLVPYYLGQALVLVGQPDTAVDAFERALTRKPTRVDLLEIYQSLGRVHQRARRNDKALAAWSRLEATFPDDARVREQIAAALAEEDQPAQALERYEKLARDVKDEYRKVQFGLEAAELKVRVGRASDALADFERLLARLDPGSWLFKEVRRKIEEVFLRNDDLAGLARYYEGWAAKNPDDVDAMARLGRVHAQLGRAGEARKWLDKAVSLAPSRRELRLALIEQLVQEKKVAEAAAQYEAMARADPNNPDLVRDWGRLLLRDTAKPDRERKANAAAVWKRLAGDEVKDAVVIAQAADLFRQAEMVDDAIALYRRAMALAPDSSQYREYLGEYYHQLKRPADALATWRSGPDKTAADKGRLGEVLAGFGYRKEALGPLTEAVRLAPDDFDLRVRLADLLAQLDRPLDALPELAAAGKLAGGGEQSEAVLVREIAAYRASDQLPARTAELEADLAAGKEATAPRWTRLARYFEAASKPAEAIRAASKATAAEPNSAVAWATLGRLEEGSGNLGAAADANRKLAAIDRRNRADYLSSIARLEARSGRIQEALKAGRELLAAAPGNIDHHREFAELCFNLGEVDEGLDALRRASRANPSDPKAATTLADALARQFRTEEAIELYWRSFDRTRDLDARLNVVARLADQYLQRNQFDRLIARLERELREPERRRELSLCLAQAHQSAGDLGAARQQLESLLASNPRDSSLLTQLANLAEAEGDVAAASRYLRQAIEIAPTGEATARLGGLQFRAGDYAEAESTWARLATADGDAARAYTAVDSLLGAGKFETVLTLTDRLLLKRPDDWDALYRQGLALANLDRSADAADRFRRILDLKGNDDALAAIPKSRKRGGSAAGPTGVVGTRMAAYYQYPLYLRSNAAYTIRSVTKIESVMSSATLGNVWTPGDFGQSRMAALGWLIAGSFKEKEPEAWTKAFQAEAEKPGADVRRLWDLYYLQLVRALPRESFAAAVRLARALPNDPAAQSAFLTALDTRDYDPNAANRARPQAGAATDKTPPLPADELALALAGFETLRKQRPDVIQPALPLNVVAELKRSNRQADADQFAREQSDSAHTVEAITAVLPLSVDRGDVDTLIALLDRRDRLAVASGQPPSAIAARSIGNMIAQAMGIKADTKDFPAILRLLDHHLASIARPEQVALRLKARNAPTTLVSSGSLRLYTSRTPSNRATPVDFPTPNAYFDSGSIFTLRNAFEIYKINDLTSDLIAHVRDLAAKAEGDARLYPTLATSYLLWWADEKEDALKEYTRAIELAPNDVELRLNLAELRARRNEPAEALEVADSVEPLDQKTMQRRELLALRLAVLGGDVERARKAAERLFGLRLDNATQVQLAAQMDQLGMHDLAEAVLARARRRTGGNASALVALMLQYQKQGKIDVATQIAGQVLRQTSGPRQTQPGTYNADDQARTEAVQVFARSGKLKELIARAESQLETSPTSTQLLQTLVDYYSADNRRDMVKATYDRLAKLRPDDARLRLQIANQLAQAGSWAESLDHYRAAIKKEPTLLSNEYYSVYQAFQQAGKLDELAKFYEGIDFKAFQSNPYVILNAVQNFFRVDATLDLGMAMLRKAWKEMPDSRASLLSMVYREETWQLAEVYDYARDALIPPAKRPIANPWAGLDQVDSWGSGTVTNVATRLIEAASRQGKLDALAAEVAEAVKRSPDWLGGRALLGILKARLGRHDEARADLEALLAGKDLFIPTYARLVLGQEMEKVESLDDIAIRVLEGNSADGVDPMRPISGGIEYGAGRRLALLYKKAGRAKDGRDLIVKIARSPGDFNSSTPAYVSYQKISEKLAIAGLFQELGFPADAARVYSDLAGDTEAIAAAVQYFGRQPEQLANQIREGLDRAIGGMGGGALGPTLKTLLTPRADAKGDEPRLDLGLLNFARRPEQGDITTLLSEAVEAPGDHKALIDEARASADRLVATFPDDLSVLVASAILSAADGKAETLAPALDRLARRVDALPLDPLPSIGRANARQRDQASAQLPLWIVARSGLKHDATRSVGEKLAARAMEAARRQADARWALAMLRESGQVALDRGDRPAAEAAWRAMLKLVLSSAPTRPAAPRPAPAPASAAAPKARPSAPVGPGVPVITVERFDQVAQLARLAADRGLAGFSVEAIGQGLAGGPPVTPIAIPNPTSSRIIVNASSATQADPIAQKVEEQLAALDAAWTKAGVDPVAAFEALRDAVLPRARPGEVFLYARPLNLSGLKTPRSVGLLLARRAVAAGKADELKAAIEARQSAPLAAGPARVLLARLALERKDYPETARLLDAIREGVAKNSLAVGGEQACHAALPALDVAATADAAARVIGASIPRVASNQEEPGGGLLIRLARREFTAGRPESGKKALTEYLARMEQSGVRYAGDYALSRRRTRIARIAGEFARAGRLDDALDQIGQYTDAPASTQYGGDGGINVALARTLRMLADRPAAERYRLLREWSLPSADRKTVRWLVQQGTDIHYPAPFASPRPVADRGLVGMSTALVDSARETGQLDALALELGPMAEARVEGASKLLARVDLARGRWKESVPAARARLEEVKKLIEARSGRNDRGQGPDLADYLLARDALAAPEPELAAVGEDLAEALVDSFPMARRDLAEARARRFGAPGVATTGDPGLILWASRSAGDPGQALRSSRTGATVGFGPSASGASTWAESDGVVARVAGPGRLDQLIDRYPLAGTFEFSVDVLGGPSGATVGYGGLVAELAGPSYQGGIRAMGEFFPIPVPGASSRTEGYNRLTIRVAPGKTTFLVNGHLFHDDTKATPGSPWLVLGASQSQPIAFRNPTLTGRPEVPREVAMASGDGLDGWDPSIYFESTAPRRRIGLRDAYGRVVKAPTKLDDFDWHARDGEIRGRRIDLSGPMVVNGNLYDSYQSAEIPGLDAVVQSQLAYARPLLDGDSVSYEFFHQPGESAVHPAIGHLAFLIEPGGVRLHALVPNGADAPPGEPGPDNVLDDPDGRRGAVALKAGDWNAATVRLKAGTVAIEVNGRLVHQRALDPDDDRTFSLYHDKARTEARARKLVLRGDWPESLAPDLIAAPFARSAADPGSGRSRAAVVGESFLQASAGDVARSARKLLAPERYRRLLAWVLPNADHASIRLAGEFGPTAPPIGPALDCPALDLVAAAVEAGSLDDLAAAVDRAETPTPLDRRGRHALLALVRAAQGRPAEANRALDGLRELAGATLARSTPEWARWPERVAGLALGPKAETNRSALALLDESVNAIRRPDRAGSIDRHFLHARGVARRLADSADQPPAPGLDGWVVATLGTAQTMGRGDPLPVWTRRDGEWRHAPGHSDDALFLASPLRGDFDLTCELSGFGHREARVSYAGIAVDVRPDLKSYEVRHLGRGPITTGPIDPPLKDVGDWYPFRLEVRAGKLTAFAQGRKLHEQAISAEADPWLAIESRGHSDSAVRKLKVAGKATVPDRVEASAGPDLIGWLGDYFGERTQGEDAAWRKVGEEIVGRKLRLEPIYAPIDGMNTNPSHPAEAVPGAKHEGLLRYARPLVEGGAVEYEFYFDPAQALVHPALGRWAFLVEPDGVKLHRITDGKHDRSGLDPANALDEPANRRGPARLPLKPRGWNRIRLEIRGDEVTLTLNGEPIYARKLDPLDGRDFGLFHFADETEARVRRVVIRGDWPKALPAELVDRPAK